MANVFAALLTSAGLLAGAQSRPAAEEKVALESLPPAVQRAVKAQSPGGKLLGVAKEVQDGVTVYEVETTLRGRRRDMIVDGQGKVLILEEETALSDIPPAARAAIQKAVGDGRLVLVEKVTKGETAFYEGHITKGSNVLEVKVDANGKPVE